MPKENPLLLVKYKSSALVFPEICQTYFINKSIWQPRYIRLYLCLCICYSCYRGTTSMPSPKTVVFKGLQLPSIQSPRQGLSVIFICKWKLSHSHSVNLVEEIPSLSSDSLHYSTDKIFWGLTLASWKNPWTLQENINPHRQRTTSKHS